MKANMRATQIFKEDTHAVSPVVATLMLVLVAAGAAVGLNVWMKSFSDDATTNVAKPSDCQALTIAGSSTVYELSVIVKPDFEAHTASLGQPVCVDLDLGGSGAGRQAAGLCVVDIGSSSSSVPSSELAKWPDCNGDGKKDVGKELRIFQVATDAVVPVSHPSNDHCGPAGTALTQLDMRSIYTKYAYDNGFWTPSNSVRTLPVTGDGSTTVLGDFAAADVGRGIFGPPVSANTRIVSVVAGTSAELDATMDVGTETLTVVQHSTLNSVYGHLSDNLDNVIWDDLSGCTGSEVIVPFDREDPGGTSEVAAQSLLGGSQKQLEDFGISLPANLQGDGNQGVWDKVNAHPDTAHALFFSGFGYAVDQGMIRHAFGVDNPPITPSTSNIKDLSFEATRPILYITAGDPSPVAQLYLDFVLGNPHNNQQYTKAAGFVGTFS